MLSFYGIFIKIYQINESEKGNGHLKFSGQPRTLLRDLTSYNGQILHELHFFVKESESTKVEAF